MVIEAFKDYCKPMKTLTVDRVEFLRKEQCNNENSDHCLAILEFTNAPSKSIGMSPAQRFFGRQLRSVLPTMKKFLSPFNVEETKTKTQKAKQHQKKYYDKNAHDLIELREGDQVTVQPYDRSQYWKRAVVIEKFKYRRYMIELENGKRLVRNRRHLRLTTKPKLSGKYPWERYEPPYSPSSYG